MIQIDPSYSCRSNSGLFLDDLTKNSRTMITDTLQHQISSHQHRYHRHQELDVQLALKSPKCQQIPLNEKIKDWLAFISVCHDDAWHEFLLAVGSERVSDHDFILCQLAVQLQGILPVELDLCCREQNEFKNIKTKKWFLF